MASAEAAHEFGALNTLLLVVILGLCILSAYLIKQNSFYYLPESAAAIVVGMIVGGLARAVYPSAEELDFLSFEPELFFFLLLPPIIFEAGYSLKKRDFFANFWTISLYAVFGTIISTFIIGFLVYWMGLIGVVEIDASSPMEALVFGALISAVDPVATLSIMGNPELNCEPLLYSLVFGESVLNDAVAIVLFKTFMTFYESEEEFSAKTIPITLLNFTAVSLGSVIVGIVIGLICSYLCKHTRMRLYPEYEISMLFLFAYGSYSFSEAIELSGIMSLFFCGIVLSHYNSYNLSATSQVTAHNIFKSLAVLSEYFVFLYIGMGIFTGRFKHINITFFVLCTIFCLVARLANTFPLSYLANLGRKRFIPWKMQCVIWFAGLRGAIAFALSQNLPAEHRDVYVSTTLGIVIFTTIVCGGLTEPILNRMGMRMAVGVENNPTDQGSGGNSASSSSGGGVGGLSSADARDSGSHTINPCVELAGKAANRAPYEHVTMDDEGADEEGMAGRTGDTDEADSDDFAELGSRPHLAKKNSYRSLMERIDHEYMNPIFGGPGRNSGTEEDDTDFHGDLAELKHMVGSGASVAGVPAATTGTGSASTGMAAAGSETTHRRHIATDNVGTSLAAPVPAGPAGASSATNASGSVNQAV